MTTGNMIVVPEDEDNKRMKEAVPASTVDDTPPPPTYTSIVPNSPVLNESGAGKPTSSTVISPAPLQQSIVKPSNFISIYRDNTAVKGTWLLDPFLAIPNMLLPPLAHDETEETRKNMSLKSSNGQIDADITLAAYESGADLGLLSRKRMTIYAKASNGTVTLKLHAPHSPRIPFHLSVDASNGAVYIRIPRTFNGLLSITTHNGSAKFSPEVSTNLTSFSDIKNTHKCFIGDYSSIVDGVEWEGDEIVVDARNGSVKVSYDQETSHSEEKKTGIFAKFFGF